jgi:hypothetical protein
LFYLSRVLHEKKVDRETSRPGDPKASNQKKGSEIRESGIRGQGNMGLAIGKKEAGLRAKDRREKRGEA